MATGKSGTARKRNQVATPEELAEGLRNLKLDVRLLSVSVPHANAAFNDFCDAAAAKAKDEGRALDLDELQAEREKLVQSERLLSDDLLAAVSIGRKSGIPMPECLKLAEALAGGMDTPEPYEFCFGARVELEALIGEVGKVSAPEAVSDGCEKVLTLNERMREAFDDRPGERRTWDAAGWAEHLKCSPESVYKLEMWKALRRMDHEERHTRTRRIENL